MLKWILSYVFRWHDWAYERGPENCSTIGICQRYDEDSYEVWRDVQHWEDDVDSDVQNGVCVDCKVLQTRFKPITSPPIRRGCVRCT